MPDFTYRRDLLLFSLAAFAAGFSLYVMRPVMVPVLFGMMMAVIIHPLVALLSRRLPYSLSVSLALLGFAGAVAVVGVLLFASLSSMADAAPRYITRVGEISASLSAAAARHGFELGDQFDMLQDYLRGLLRHLTGLLSSIVSLAVGVGLVLVLMVFFLFEAGRARPRVMLAFGPVRGAAALSVLDPLALSINRYLATKTLVSLGNGALTYAICFAAGVDFAFTLGFFAFVLNYIPYFGPLLAALTPAAVAFLQFDSPVTALALLAVLGVIQVASGSVIEPQVFGRSLRISPLFVFISMVFCGWFWGLPGVFLSVPLLSAFVIACAHVKPLRPVATMLGVVPFGGAPPKGWEKNAVV